MMPNIFETKLTLDEALDQWSQRVKLGKNEPQNKGFSAVPMPTNQDRAVQNVVRPRRGHDY